MKFIIDIEDFWLEEEELTNALQTHIKREVVNQISQDVREQTQKQITEKLQDVIKQKIEIVIDSTLTDLVATGMSYQNSKNEISIVDYIKNVFTKNAGWSNPKAQIEKIAKDFTLELKAQYNTVFANRLVVNMKEQGFLKDDLVQVLLEEK